MFLQIIVQIFHPRILNGVAEFARFFRRKGEQSGIISVRHRVDRHSLAVHQLSQHLCRIEKHLLRLIGFQTGGDLVYFSKTVPLVDQLCLEALLHAHVTVVDIGDIVHLPA